jgi:hypothetical protein
MLMNAFVLDTGHIVVVGGYTVVVNGFHMIDFVGDIVVIVDVGCCCRWWQLVGVHNFDVGCWLLLLLIILRLLLHYYWC